MKVVQADKVEGKPASFHRGGSSVYTHLVEGDDASPVDNFSLIIARTPGRFSPRHRHNFEQFRYQLEGVADYGRTGKLKPGMIGYFPEGVHYGPQTQDPGETLKMLVLQCGGASGSGYPGRKAVMAAQEEMRKYGHFKDGVFYRNEGVPGKRNLDSFQAIWEHVAGRPMVYPKPRYDVPILMHPDAFEWVPVEGAAGVCERQMGAFTERQASARFLKLDPGAVLSMTGKRDILFVVSGTGKVKGGAKSDPLRAHTTVYLEPGDKAVLEAKQETEILNIRLPDLSGVRSWSRSDHVEAAE
jgi:mannose-6-phosphate isomerase-like protein (cupin superfamily)